MADEGQFPDSGSQGWNEKRGGTVNIFTLVLRAIDPIRATWNRRDEVGASLVEYALLLALIAVVALVALHFLGGTVANTLNNVGSSINNAP